MTEDDAGEPARPSRWRQIKALMKIRLLTERRMPSVWLMRIVMPVALVLFGALYYAVPSGLLMFSRLELKAGYYVNDVNVSRSTVNPGLALLSDLSAGLSLFSLHRHACYTTGNILQPVATYCLRDNLCKTHVIQCCF